MRFDLVHALSFGPFVDQKLRFAPGFNVVFGPNEAGKSTWHAALYAALCGIRRGRGRASPEEAEFEERHFPAGRADWQVQCEVTLDDGRRIGLQQDLKGRVRCRAVDLQLGHDLSGELMNGGAPDGAKLVGLDRAALGATAYVRQADLLGIVDKRDTLHAYLQRAAASTEAQMTASDAIARLDAFRRENVGTPQAPTRPWRVSRDRIIRLEAELNHAVEERTAFDARAREVEARAEEARNAELGLRYLRAALASRALREGEARFERAIELQASFPDGPPGDEGGEIESEVIAALTSWRERPGLVSLEGETAEEIERQIRALPEAPSGDTQPHPAVVQAAEDFARARARLALHEERRPAPTNGPEASALSEDALRSIARDLETPIPKIPPEPRRRVEEATARSLQLSKARFPAPSLLGVALAVVGVLLAGLGLLIPGLALLVAGGGVALWAMQAQQARRIQAMLDLGRVKGELAAALAQREAAEAIVATAASLACSHALPSDPVALRALADQTREALAARREYQSWEGIRAKLAADLDHRAQILWHRLEERGETVDDELDRVLARYEEDCHARQARTREADRRGTLLVQLANRRVQEQAAADVRAQHDRAVAKLRELGARDVFRAGRTDRSDADIAEDLERWRIRRAEELDLRRRRLQDWNALEHLLDGKSIEQLRQERDATREAYRSVSAGLDLARIDATVVEDDSLAQLERAQQRATEARARAAEARGLLEGQASNLGSPAEVEEALAQARAEHARITRLGETLDLTSSFLARARERAHRIIAPRLAQSVGERLNGITEGRYVGVIVDPDRLELQVEDAAGWRHPTTQLSHGTIEQIYLLLRVAMAENLAKPGETCPLILDDVTVQFDAERTTAVLSCLQALSQERQVILFTQEADVLAWARANLDAPEDQLTVLDRVALAS